MRIAITGHSQGLGKAIADHFQNFGHTVIGYSRTNGFDISQEDTRNKIIEELKSCDVFINNAYAPFAQKDLLVRAIDLWKNDNKTIININSKSTLIAVCPDYMKEYAADKQQQQKIIRDRIFKARPYIMNFTPGLIDTAMSENFKSKKLNTKKLAEFIYVLLEFKDSIAIQDVLVEVPDLDWNDIERL